MPQGQYRSVRYNNDDTTTDKGLCLVLTLSSRIFFVTTTKQLFSVSFLRKFYSKFEKVGFGEETGLVPIPCVC